MILLDRRNTWLFLYRALFRQAEAKVEAEVEAKVEAEVEAKVEAEVEAKVEAKVKSKVFGEIFDRPGSTEPDNFLFILGAITPKMFFEVSGDASDERRTRRTTNQTNDEP